MHYESFDLVLTEPREVDASFWLDVQVIAAAGLPAIIEPIASRCDLGVIRRLSDADSSRAPDAATILETGLAIGRALAPGAVAARLREALGLVRSHGQGLRIRLIGGDSVHDIPWEYAVLAPDHGDATPSDFLALMPDVSIVRVHSAVSTLSISSSRYLKAARPFRIAGTAADPGRTGQLDVAKERELLESALQGAARTVELSWSPNGSRPSVAMKAQMFHFAGHGTFEPGASRSTDARDIEFSELAPATTAPGAGSLIFEGPDGGPDPVSAGELGVILREMGVRVAVLNACKTARRDGTSAWSSVAAALLNAGVHCVVAMQHPILDTSAIAFAAAFYSALGAGRSLDEATHAGRLAVYERDGFGWGTPVLYLCRPDGDVFPEARAAARPEIPPKIEELIHEFEGRAWLLPRIAEWLDEGSERIFLITGAPGTGKTMIAAWLLGLGPDPEDLESAGRRTRLTSAIAAAHFCAAATRTVIPSAFASSIASQLAANLPGFVEATAARSVGALDDERVFHELVREPLRAWASTRQDDTIVILIDALDEALTYTGRIDITSLLARIDDLPPNVRILATTRPAPAVLDPLRDARRLDLIEHAPLDHDDVRAYARRRLTGSDPDAEAHAAQIAALSSGIFLYAYLLLEDRQIIEGRARGEASLPRGLDGLYEKFLSRFLGGAKNQVWTEHVRPILGAIAVAYGTGLSRATIAGIVESDPDEALAAARQYLQGPLPDGPFRMFHKSFADFLIEGPERHPYRIDAAEMHGRIARYFLREHTGMWASCSDRYALEYTPQHLLRAALDASRRPVRSEHAQLLHELLIDLEFLESKLEQIGIHNLLRDLYEAETAELATPISPLLRDLARVIAHEAGGLDIFSRQTTPALLAQQVYNRARAVRLTALEQHASTWLAEQRQPYLALRWSSGGHSARHRREWHLLRSNITRLALVGGDRVVAVATASTLATVDLATGQRLRQWSRRTGDSDTDRRSGVFSADGMRYLHALDRSASLLDTAACEVIAVLPEAPAPISSLALAPDGSFALAGLADGRIVGWDLRTSRPLSWILVGPSSRIVALAIAPNGDDVLSGSADGRLELSSLARGTTLRLDRHPDVLGVQFSGDGRRVVSASNEALYVRDLSDRRVVLKLAIRNLLYPDVPPAFALTRDGRRLVIGVGRPVRILNVDTNTGSDDLHGHNLPITALALSSDERTVVSLDMIGVIHQWDLIEESDSSRPHTSPVVSLAMSRDATRAVSASYDGAMCVWELQTGTVIGDLTGYDGSVQHQISISTDGSLVFGCSARGAEAWRLATGTRTQLVEIAQQSDVRTAFSRDGRFMATARPLNHRGILATHHEIHVRDLESRTPAATLASVKGYMPELALRGADPYVLVNAGHSWNVWDVRTNEQVRNMTTLAGLAWTRMAISADGSLTVRAESQFGAILLYRTDAPDARVMLFLDSAPSCVAIDDSGRVIVAADELGGVYCFDLVGELG